jgi:hypothetical protein
MRDPAAAAVWRWLWCMRRQVTACGKPLSEFGPTERLTSAVIGLLGRREEGQTLADEVLVVAMIVFAVFGAIALLGRLT